LSLKGHSPVVKNYKGRPYNRVTCLYEQQQQQQEYKGDTDDMF